ncbi:uncharacterized protein O3C94_006046 isoform 2-T2 [Discoglossus pictus]
MRLSLVWGCVALSVLVLATGEETGGRDGEDKFLAERVKRQARDKSKPKPKPVSNRNRRPRPRPCPGCFSSLFVDLLEKRRSEVPKTKVKFRDTKIRVKRQANGKRKPKPVSRPKPTRKPCPGCLSPLFVDLLAAKRSADMAKTKVGILAEKIKVKRKTRDNLKPVPKPRRRPCPGCYSPFIVHPEDKVIDEIKREKRESGNKPKRKPKPKPTAKPKRCPGCYSALDVPLLEIRET